MDFGNNKNFMNPNFGGNRVTSDLSKINQMKNNNLNKQIYDNSYVENSLDDLYNNKTVSYKDVNKSADRKNFINPNNMKRG
ncbi:MAG: hypothetical protein PUA68_05570 [Bacilli bacterium]|nr:hypothetical protein [Bacilli bacterium]